VYNNNNKPALIQLKRLDEKQNADAVADAADILTIRWYTLYCYRVNAVGEHAEQRTRQRLRRLRIMAVKKIIFRKIVFELKTNLEPQ